MKKMLLFILINCSMHPTIDEFVWGNCSLSFGSNYNFTQTRRRDGLFINIEGDLTGLDARIDKINTFECSDVRSQKKPCAELKKVVKDINDKNKKMSFNQLDKLIGSLLQKSS